MVEHEECPFRASLVCRRCCSSGHTSTDCTYTNTIHPLYIEDLIPNDIKDHYGISTHTTYMKPHVPVQPHAVQCIEIKNDDKWIRQFMKNKHIQTARKQDDNLKKITEWANGCGLYIRLTNQE